MGGVACHAGPKFALVDDAESFDIGEGRWWGVGVSGAEADYSPGEDASTSGDGDERGNQ